MRLTNAITISALLEAQTPVRHHDRVSDSGCILLGNSLRLGASHEVQIQHTSEEVVLEILLSRCCLVDDDVFAIAVQEEHAMRVARCTVIVVDLVGYEL